MNIKTINVFVLFLVACLTYQTNHSMADETDRFPKVFLEKNSHDFGTVNEGDELSITLKIKNTGNNTLSVSAPSGCGITTIFLSNPNIEPGGTCEIEIRLGTKGRYGKMETSFSLRTNDPDNPAVIIRFSAYVVAQTEVSPVQLYLGRMGKNQTFMRNILILGGKELEITGIQAPEGIRSSPGDSWISELGLKKIPVNFEITIDHSPGDYQEIISILTNDHRKPIIELSIKGNIIGDLTADQKILFWPNAVAGGITSKNVRLDPSENQISDLQAICSSDYFEINTDRSEDGEYLLSILFKAPDDATTVKDTLRVFIKNREYPELTIPVIANVTKN